MQTGQKERRGCLDFRPCSRTSAPSGQPQTRPSVFRLFGLFSLISLGVSLIHSRVELKRLCEIFTRMFADPHSKVGVHADQVFAPKATTFIHNIITHRFIFHPLWFYFCSTLFTPPSSTVPDSARTNTKRSHFYTHRCLLTSQVLKTDSKLRLEIKMN